ncbi:P-loop containing nucleoside triphosphate hydrolase protein [Rostrohypoxylon terebratum]|nr:P-loop containing nucleoside triphosphate hydrolase protein [Rostrohypoxylon terebratum]
MRSFLSATICPACQFASKIRPILPIISRTWANQRFYAGGPKTRPSRMVLSDRVARPPRRDSRDHDGTTARPRREGPFGGMNQTYANIRQPISRNPFRNNNDRSRDVGGWVKRGSQPDKQMDHRRIKAMKMRGALATIPYGDRRRTKENIIRIQSFDDFDLLPSVKEAISQDALKGMVDIKPTPIQRLAIPALLGQDTGRRFFQSSKSNSRQEFLLAAETGSGKTLAYLLPVINALKEAEAADPTITAYQDAFTKQIQAMKEPGYTGPREFDPHPTTARPRVVVLVPTAELVDQVGAVAKKLSHLIKFRASLFSANFSAVVINANMYRPTGIDLVVSTPHLLASMADSDPNILSRVSHLVVDEADSLFDRSFAPVTTSILDRALPSLKQLILCSATIPKRLESYLSSEFPNMVRLTTPNLHAIPRRVQLGSIDVSKDPYRDNKDLACADAIWSIGKDGARHEGPEPEVADVKHIMVFVNEREKTQSVANFLVTKGIDAVALHRDTTESRQSEMLESFMTTEPVKVTAKKPAIPHPGKGRRILPNVKVIVATDLASRGIDTLAVRHVILYDVPHSTIDFIHRLGRAGRMGRRGRGIVLVDRHDRKDIVAEVRESMFMGQALI